MLNAERRNKYISNSNSDDQRPMMTSENNMNPDSNFLYSTLIHVILDAGDEAKNISSGLNSLRIRILNQSVPEVTDQAKQEERVPNSEHTKRLTESALREWQRLISRFKEEIDVLDRHLREKAYLQFPSLFQPLLPSLPVLINGDDEDSCHASGSGSGSSSALIVNNVVNHVEAEVDSNIKPRSPESEAMVPSPPLATATEKSPARRPPSRTKAKESQPHHHQLGLHQVHHQLQKLVSVQQPDPLLLHARSRYDTIQLMEISTSISESGSDIDITPSDDDVVCDVPRPIDVQVDAFFDGIELDEEDEALLLSSPSPPQSPAPPPAAAPVPSEPEQPPIPESVAQPEQPTIPAATTEPERPTIPASVAEQPTIPTSAPEPDQRAITTPAVEPEPQAPEALLPISLGTDEPESTTAPAAPPATNGDPKLRPGAAKARVDRFPKSIENKLKSSSRGRPPRILLPHSESDADDESEALSQPEDESEDARHLRLLNSAIRQLQKSNKVREVKNDEARAKAKARDRRRSRRRSTRANDVYDSFESDLDSLDEELNLGQGRLSNVPNNSAPTMNGNTPANNNHHSDDDDIDGNPIDLRPPSSGSESEARRRLLEESSEESDGNIQPPIPAVVIEPPPTPPRSIVSSNSSRKRTVRARRLPQIVSDSSSEDEVKPSTRQYPKRKASSQSLPIEVVEINTANEDESGDEGPASPAITSLLVRKRRRCIISSTDSACSSSTTDAAGSQEDEESSISDGDSSIKCLTLGHISSTPFVYIKDEIHDPPEPDADEEIVEVAVPSRPRFSPIAPEFEELSPATPSTSRGKTKGRRNILPIIPDEQLRPETQIAGLAEEKRLKRIEERDRYLQSLPRTPGFILDPEPQPPVEVANGIAQHLKQHQKEGIEFMWKSCFESQTQALSTEGGGCILAHSMGLGKTLQVIALLHTILRTENLGTRFKRALIVCPKVVVTNWREEIKFWQNDILSTEKMPVFILSKSKQERAEQVRQWRDQGGVGLVHYEVLQMLIPEKFARGNVTLAAATGQPQPQQGPAIVPNGEVANEPAPTPAAAPAPAATPTPTIIITEEQALFEECLRSPGPDILVLDEGHRLKNRGKTRYKIVRSIKTMRKIILSGTPLQNNLSEYYSMLSLIKPDLLGSTTEFANRFINPIKNGQWKGSTLEDAEKMMGRTYVLSKLVSGCVHRRSSAILLEELEPKHEFTIGINLTPLQAQLYNEYLNHVRLSRRRNFMTDAQTMRKIIAHPHILTQPTTKEKRAQKMKRTTTRTTATRRLAGATEEGIESDDDSDSMVQVDEDERAPGECWYNSVLTEPPPAGIPVVNVRSFEISAKLCVLRTIVELCESTGERLLVFSQYLKSLDQIQTLLQEMHDEHEEVALGTCSLHDGAESVFSRGKWRLGMDYIRLDGETKVEDREKSIAQFNTPNSRVKLFLIGTFAGSLGINLIGANRVVVFDASWNPSNDLQAIHRVYRYGQRLTCYVYRLLGQHTMEEKVYNGQIIKLGLAQRVVDKKSVERKIAMDEAENLLYDPYPDQIPTPPAPDPQLLQTDAVLAKLVEAHSTLIHSIREHSSMLQDDVNLTEEQERTAMETYNTEATKRVTRSQTNAATASAAAGQGQVAGTSGGGGGGRGGGRSGTATKRGGGAGGKGRKVQNSALQIPEKIWKNVYFNLCNAFAHDPGKCANELRALKVRSDTVIVHYEKARNESLPRQDRQQSYVQFQELRNDLQKRFKTINVHYNLHLQYPDIAFDPPPTAQQQSSTRPTSFASINPTLPQ